MVALLLDKWVPHPLARDHILRLTVETPPVPFGTTREYIDQQRPIVEALGQLVQHAGGVLLPPPQA
jgi:hypothetical protein